MSEPLPQLRKKVVEDVEEEDLFKTIYFVTYRDPLGGVKGAGEMGFYAQITLHTVCVGQ